MLQVYSWIGGEEVNESPIKYLEVRNPYNDELIGKVACATEKDVIRAIETAETVFTNTMKTMPAHERSRILRNASILLEEQAEQFAQILVLEAGKPITEARGEVARAVQVLLFASEGAKQLNGEQIVLDNAVGGEGQFGFSKRVPLGVIVAITPFNFPLNMVLHKVAPALASGNTIVLKPAEKTPLSAVRLHQLLQEAGVPDGAFNIVHGPGAELVPTLVTHPFVKKVTFTGSDTVGWKINEMAAGKKVTLELGCNAPNIIFDDADLENAANAIVMGGFTFAGQACVSAQRIYVQVQVYDDFMEKLIAKVSALKMGDLQDESTALGPMISLDAAKRAESWIQEAVAQGAVIRSGGKRTGTMLEPTILDQVTADMNVVCAEVFAPIVAVLPFITEDEVIDYANDSKYGLQAGIFTNNLNRALKLADRLETGGVWINEVSVRRYDHIPYGGIKESGIGKEGIQYSMEAMTAVKFIGIKLL